MEKDFASSGDLIHAYIQSGKYSVTEILELIKLFPIGEPLPQNYKELLEKAWIKHATKPNTI